MSERHYSTYGPICPHCEHEHCANEPVYFDDNTTELDCDHCGKSFGVEIYHSTSWTTEAPTEPEITGEPS